MKRQGLSSSLYPPIQFLLTVAFFTVFNLPISACSLPPLGPGALAPATPPLSVDLVQGSETSKVHYNRNELLFMTAARQCEDNVSNLGNRQHTSGMLTGIIIIK